MRKLMVVIGIVALAGCSGVSKEQYGAVQADAAKSKKSAEEAAAQVSALEQKNAALQAQVTDLQGKLASTSEAKTYLETTSAQLGKQAQELQRKQSIKLADKLLFQEKSSVLTPEAKRTLDSIADAVAEVSDKILIVGGFTDDKEAGAKDPAAKWQLSTARALAVAKYLAGRGVSAKRIAVAGFADARPVAPNDSIANRALNRRVEIALTPADLVLGTIDVKPATLKPPK